MKRFGMLCLLWACISTFAHGQQKEEGQIHAVEIPVQYLGVSGRLDQYVEPHGTVNEITKSEKLGVHPKSDWPAGDPVDPASQPNGMDPVWQDNYAPPAPPTKALTINFDGMGYSNVNPADPSLDVGPNHVVQMINGPSGSYVRIYDKTGSPLTNQVYFDNWLGFTGGGAGDPIVMYDERADRWFLSEFSPQGPNNLYVAISTTNDPTGTYHTYIFNSPGGFPDYPKYSIWNDAYVMTANVGVPDIFALNRADMLAGTPTTAQMFNQSNFGTIGFQASTPVSLNGTVEAPAGQNPLLMRVRDGAWNGAANDALEMWELDIDWANSANSTLGQVQTLPIANHDSELCGYTSFSCFPQPGGGPALDPLREILMNRIHYRNFGTHESIVCCHVTDVDGNDRGGIRWYELRRTNGTSGTWSIYQESTYSPDTENRWMPSIGISATGNIGLAYSVASNTVYPSLRYTGRRECDPLNSMSQGETTIIAGTASNGSNRWGDYFQLGLDPSDGETFWHTGCYNTSASWSTRISAFDIPTCTPQISFTQNAYSEDEANGTTANATNDCLPYVDITVPISIGSAPTQNADVTVAVSGGTATPGVDFDLLNATHTLGGSSLSGNATIRVYNDDIIEGAETITLNYTFNANGGNATAGTINQTVTITINDDDQAPTSPLVATLLSENFESGSLGAFTTVNPSGDTPWQVANVGTAASGAYAIPTTNTGQFAYVNDDVCNCNQNAVDLIFPAVNLTGGYTAAALTFSSYFEDNTYQTNNENADLYVSVNGAPDALVGALTASGVDGPWVNQNFDLTPYIGNNNVVFKVRYSDATGWLYGCTVDDVLITATGPAIQTATNVGAGDNVYLGPNATVHVYDPNSSRVMVTLENTSSFDYGCVDIEVDRAGTGALQFNTATAADYVTSKTYTVVPTNNNPSGTFNITLYYEEAEVAGWEAATGNSRNNAEIIKVAGNNRINDVTPANAATFTIANSAATLGALGSDVTFTAPFTSGFSGFGVGIYNGNTLSAPTANFSGTPTTICAGQTVTFTDLSTGSPTGWSWDFGDTGSSTTQNPTHTYNTPGTYTVTLTASNSGGSDAHSITNYITVNPIPAITAGTLTDPSTCGGSNGSIVINGTGTGTVSWTGTASGTSGSVTLPYTISGLAAGSYNVSFVANGCNSNTLNNITLSDPANPAAPTISAGGPTTFCAGGSVTLTSSYSGSGNAWAPGGQTTDNITVTAAGTYTVTYTDGNGCTSTASAPVTVTVNPNPSITQGTVSNPSSCGGSDGSIVINGTGTGTVAWTGTASGNSGSVTLPYTISGLAAGSYNVTFTANGCPSNTLNNITLADPSAPAAPTISAGGPTTFCAGGSVTLTSSYSGAGNAWSPGGQTTDNITVTAAGTYTVTYTDGSGCTSAASAPITVTVNPNPSITPGTVTDPTTCGGSNGSIVISGTGTGTVAWTGTASGNSGSVTLPYTISGLAAGSYNVTFTANGCPSNTLNNIILTDPANPAAPTISAGGPTTFCAGGSVTLTSSYSGAGNAWAPGGQTTDNITVTAAGTYSVTYTDGNGCTSAASAPITVTVNPNPSITPGTVTDPTTCGGSNGSIVISGTGTGTVAWTGTASGNSGSVTLPYTISGLAAGSYNVTFTANGCPSNTLNNITLTDPSAPAAPTISAGGATTFCDGGNVTLTSSYSGSGNAWSPGGQTTDNITVTAAGTYTVTYTDGSGCTSAASAPITVTVNPNPSITPGTVNDPTSCGGSDGTIVINGTGTGTVAWTGTASGNSGSVTLPYTISGLAAGSYNVTFTANGCPSNTLNNITLTDPSAPAAPTITASGSTTICDGETVTLTSSYSGAGNVWSPGGQTTDNIAVTTAGTYTVTYTDAVGCTSPASAPVTVTVNPTSNSTQDVEICEGSSYTIGSNTYTTAGTYTDVLTNQNGCDSTVITNLTVNPLPQVSMTPTTIDTLCLNSSGPISLVGTPAGGSFSGPGVSGTTFSPSAAGIGTHTITYAYTDGNGCEGTVSVVAVVDECAGIEEQGLEGVSLYPNPNEGIFMVTGLEIGESYEIYDDRGRLVVRGVVETENQEVRIPDAQTGMYYLQATANGKTGSLKFIITK